MEDLLIKLERNNINTITIFDSNYPKDLINIPDKPLVIYTKGEYKVEDHLAIGIVGSEKPQLMESGHVKNLQKS